MPWVNCATAAASQDPQATGTRLWNEPPQTIARTYRRDEGGSAQQVTGGTVMLRQIILPKGLTAGAMTMATNTTAKTGGSHGWYVVTDQYLNVLAVTADQTDAATVWGTIYTPYKLPFTSLLSCAYTGVYYAGVMIVATGRPNLVYTPGTNAGLWGAPPILCGTSSAGQTTPPAVGSQLTALTFSPACGWYITLQSS